MEIDSVGALVSSEIAGIAGVIFVCDDMSDGEEAKQERILKDLILDNFYVVGEGVVLNINMLMVRT